MKKNFMYDKFKNHIGHNIVCASYGDYYDPDDICIECEDCNEVLISTETLEEEKNTIKNLIEAMCDYGLEYSFTDNEVIEALIECGIEKQDFIDCGYENFVSEYFQDDEDEDDKDVEISYKWDEAWDKEVERRLNEE